MLSVVTNDTAAHTKVAAMKSFIFMWAQSTSEYRLLTVDNASHEMCLVLRGERTVKAAFNLPFGKGN